MNAYLTNYYYVAAFAIVGGLFGGLLLTVAKLLRPNKVSREKLLPYECGMDPFGGGWSQHTTRFYVFALLFLIFDVEIAFLYPWATVFRKGGITSLVEMFVFIFVLLVGLIYAWKKGVLKWL